jgi:ribosomal protein S12 methylthiotransferase accessory factor
MDMQITFPGGKRVRAHYNDFTVETDQSREHGGEGSAPSPFDLFLVALGTCAATYVLSFCQARRLPTDKLRVEVAIDRDEKTHMVNTISILIDPSSECPEEYRDKLVEVARKCTVKKHLEKPPVIDIQVAAHEGFKQSAYSLLPATHLQEQGE